jgi:translin
MINKAEFKEILKDMKDFEDKREGLISDSRNVIKLSKQIIYSLHRNDLSNAKKLVSKIRKEVKKIPTERYDTGMGFTALQEYVEALTYFYFVLEQRIPTRKELSVDTRAYLSGISDLTGELVRKAVNEAIHNNFGSVEAIRGLVEEIYGEFLKFDFRNGELRKKSDSIKYNLQKLEQLAYELKSKNE